MRVSRLGTYVLGVVVGVSLSTGFSALASPNRNPKAHDAIVLCNHLAEDSATHVRLVDYGHDGNPLVYRCERNGY